MLDPPVQSVDQTAEVVELNLGGLGVLKPLDELKIRLLVKDLAKFILIEKSRETFYHPVILTQLVVRNFGAKIINEHCHLLLIFLHVFLMYIDHLHPSFVAL